jgi:hypothetical protein
MISYFYYTIYQTIFPHFNSNYLFIIKKGLGFFPHLNLYVNTNSVLARQEHYSKNKENIKRGLNYFDNFSSFLHKIKTHKQLSP